MPEASIRKVHGVKELLEGYPRKRSREFYLLTIARFFEWKFKVSCTKGEKKEKRIDLETIEKLARAYLTDHSDYGGDLLRYTAHLTEHYSPLARRSYLTPIRQLLIMNDVEIKPSLERMIRRKLPRGYHARTRDEPFTLEMLRKVCDNAPLRLRALLLVLLSSGARLNEIIQVVPEDIDFNAKPVTIHLKDGYTKTGAPRDVFISGEAVTALKEWIAARNDYLRYKVKVVMNIEKKILEGDRRVFPITKASVTRLFNDALLRSGYCEAERGKKGEKIPIKDKETRRSPIHIHGLRKTFRTQLARAEAPGSIDITEKLMGHEGYLTSSYVRLDDEEVRKFYLENEHRLWIHPPQLSEKDRQNMKNLQDENTRLTKELESIRELITRQQAIEAHPLFNEVMKCIPDLVEREVQKRLSRPG